MPTNRKIKLGVLISGDGTNLQAIIDASQAGSLDATIEIVISDNDTALGLDRARSSGIPSRAIVREEFKSRDAFEEAIVGELGKHGAELVCLAGFMRIVGDKILSAFPQRVINIHPALLPSFPGLNAQKQAHDYGVKISGCTVHFVDENTDHGPIICQTAVEVKNDDTVKSLKERILREEHRIYPEAIQLIAEGRVAIDGRCVKVTMKGCS